MRIITAAFIFYEGKLLLVMHNKIKKWMHVGGHAEEDEHFDETLLREVKEETGLEVDVIDPDPIPNKYPERWFYVLKKPFFMHVMKKEGAEDDLVERRLLLDYVAVARSDKIFLQEEELSDFKWVTREGLEKEENIYPALKDLAFQAFDFYEKHSKDAKK
ncbi:NUDIX hydrolase [Candidatus Woesearchaeota archaeon]|nr:NUDIX hydrolase [Candidatus Woesearchaeota archaeon]